MMNKILPIAQQAGCLILEIYQQSSFVVQHKLDQSPLTQADSLADEYISHALSTAFPEIPIISEESSNQYEYALRKNWETFFLVDPLDGTKEFIQRNGEFTVNIALIHHNQPILGIIHAPTLNVTYYAEKNKGAHKISHGIHQILPIVPPSSQKILRVITSRSHTCQKTLEFLEELQQQKKSIQTTSIGSALKFGLIAEGLADIYPRFSPTMEWDTAAGHILVNEVGKKVIGLDHQLLKYNKPDLINVGFIVS